MIYHLIILILFNGTEGANILAWFTCPSISHQHVFQPIWKELSLRGHQVIVIAPNPLKDPSLVNLTEVDTQITYKVWKEIDISNMRRDVMSSFEIEYYFQKTHEKTIEMAFQTSEVQNILGYSEDYFDLIIIESHHPILYGLQNKFDAPLIAISSLGNFKYLHYLFGNSIHPALYGDFISGLTGSLTFLEKIDNFYMTVGNYLMYKFLIYPNSDRIARSYFGINMPCIEEMIQKTSILFENINPIFSNNRQLAPNVMQFSNAEIPKNIPLPKDLQQILDNAKNGVVYFSLGTNVRFDHVEKDFKNTVLRTLGELPYTVLCKWESEDYPGKPKNVVLRKWFPQQSVLAHPNIKVFVTQGGLQSSEEAIINAVPLVIIPFLGDQPMNARILTSHGMAETIQPNKLTQEDLKETIMKVATEEKYHTRAKELREIFLDQPQSGLDKIVWWCEYVIRHKGAKHLRSPGADIPLYEYFMLDLLAVFIAALLVFYMVVKQLFKLMKYSFQYIKQKKD